MKRLSALFLVSLVAACNSTTPTEVLQKYGYGVHVPPSSLHGPGNLVYKRPTPKDRSEQLILGDICSPAYLKLPPNLQRSSGEKIDFARNTSFEMDSAALRKLGLDLAASYTRSVTLSFSNTEVLEYSLEDLQSIRNNLGPVCAEILEKQVEKGNAYQVVGAFKADLAYNIEYKGQLSIELQTKIQKELAAKFGIEFSGSEGHVGSGLYYGLFLDKV